MTALVVSLALLVVFAAGVALTVLVQHAAYKRRVRGYLDFTRLRTHQSVASTGVPGDWIGTWPRAPHVSAPTATEITEVLP